MAPRTPAPRRRPARLGSEPEEAARNLREEVESHGGTLATTVRALRDRLGHRRLTAAARAEIDAAMKVVGLESTPPLLHAELDDALEVRVVGPATGAGRWWRRTVRGGVKVWQVLIALLGLAATVIGLYSFADERLRDPPAPPALSGDLRIAIASFRVVDARGRPVDSQQGAAFAQSFFAALEPRLRSAVRSGGEPYQIGVRGPRELGAIQGDDAAARARSAGELASRNNADVVLYGDIRASEFDTRLVPEIYVTPTFLAGEEELAGRYGLGAPLESLGRIDASVETRRSLRDRLLDRTDALAQFLVGLGQFTNAKYSAAARRFRAAARTPGEGGKAVVFLFLGNAEVRSHRLEAARTAYQRALKLEPDYARARFGLAEVTFQQACRGGGSADRAGLRRAVAEYEQVLRAPLQPDSFPMRVKTNLGIGKAVLCMAPPDCPAATTRFESVIADYRDRRSRLRDETAEAWGGLGVALELCRDPAFAGPEPRGLEVARRYEQAAAVALLPARRAYYLSEVGRIYADLGDVDRAAAAYDRALAVEPSRVLRRRYRAARAALHSS